MKKENDRLFIIGIIFGILILIFSVNLVVGSFQLALGNESYSVELVYGPSGTVKGWMNISFQDELIDSVISDNFEGSINLIDFLDADFATYTCSPINCGGDYVSSNGEDSKSFSLGYEEEKIISFFIGEGTVSSINELKFDVSVSNNPGCINPLKIDILDDEVTEWSSRNFLNDYSCKYEQGTGCFDAGEYPAIIDNEKPYCEKINLIESGKFKLGAWVKNGSTTWYSGLLEMFLYDLDGSRLASCDLPEPSEEGGEISCIVEYKNDRIQEYYICIKASDSIEGYETKRESIEPCGFYAYPGDQTEYHDYYIFAKSAKFDNIGQVVFNQEEYEEQENLGELSDYLFQYINERYEGNCIDGCSIPIKFKSYGGLNIEISNAKLKYSTGAGPEITNLIYDTSTEKAKINSDFQKLNLEKTGFLVPSGIGSYTLRLELNNETLLEEYIEVVAVPTIQDIIPHDVPSLVSVKFRVLINETGTLTYTWDFGDGGGETTDTKIVEHIYSSLGNYNLSVTVKNEFGNSSKTVQITVGSPKDYINETIQDYNGKLDAVQTEINKLPEWIKSQIDVVVGVSDLKSEIKVQEDKYKEAFSDEDYTDIMADLLGMEIPDSFGISQTFSSLQMFPAEGQINLDVLENMGAGNIEADDETYACAVTTWIKENLDIGLESKTYSVYYDGEEEPLYSYIKITLTPKQDLEEVYFLINGASADVKFKEDYKMKEYQGMDFGKIFSELTESKTIEFLYAGKIDIGDFPIYAAPEFKNLELEAKPGICNFNKRCEKDLGENYKNCRSDCKPLGWTLFWLFILLAGAFIVYIILQEWYKRFYESRLFKNKNQLFNLIHFMNNSFNQGVGRMKIFGNLKKLDWSGEQLTYAWNKLHGKRTGMWEIPMFKWVEKKQVKRELAKREGVGVQPVPEKPEGSGLERSGFFRRRYPRKGFRR